MVQRAVAMAVVTLALATACSSPPEVPLGPDGRPDPVLAEGRDIFGARCSSCHGTSGGGGRGPNIQSERVVAKYPDIEAQVDVVAQGRNQMPGFGDVLSPAELEAVVRYTREVL